MKSIVGGQGWSVMLRNRSMLAWLLLTAKIAWTVSVMAIATTVGASTGWETHGISGAMALGFVGFVAGALFSSPSFLFEFLS
jgi:hypothetical protein